MGKILRSFAVFTVSVARRYNALFTMCIRVQLCRAMRYGPSDLPRSHRSPRRSDIEAIAEAMAYEQAVELPPALVPEIRERVVAQITSIREVDECYFNVTLAFSARLADVNLSQLLNLICKTSIYDGVRSSTCGYPTMCSPTIAGQTSALKAFVH